MSTAREAIRAQFFLTTKTVVMQVVGHEKS
jgi:hypothetical protein